jgi:hypothetical protein
MQLDTWIPASAGMTKLPMSVIPVKTGIQNIFIIRCVLIGLDDYE